VPSTPAIGCCSVSRRRHAERGEDVDSHSGLPSCRNHDSPTLEIHLPHAGSRAAGQARVELEHVVAGIVEHLPDTVPGAVLPPLHREPDELEKRSTVCLERRRDSRGTCEWSHPVDAPFEANDGTFCDPRSRRRSSTVRRRRTRSPRSRTRLRGRSGLRRRTSRRVRAGAPLGRSERSQSPRSVNSSTPRRDRSRRRRIVVLRCAMLEVECPVRAGGSASYGAPTLPELITRLAGVVRSNCIGVCPPHDHIGVYVGESGAIRSSGVRSVKMSGRSAASRDSRACGQSARSAAARAGRNLLVGSARPRCASISGGASAGSRA